MKTRAWMEAFGEIGDRYLEEAMQIPGQRQTKRRIWWARYAVTAGSMLVLAVIIIASVFRAGSGTKLNPGKPDDGIAAVDMADRDMQNEQSSSGTEVLLDELPELVFSKSPSDMMMEADIALPKGYFFYDMTVEDIASIWGQNELNWEGLGITDEYDLTGRIIYDGTGTVWEATIRGNVPGTEDNGFPLFTLTMSPDGLPPECVVLDIKRHTCQIWETPVDAFRVPASGEGSYGYYCIRFVRQEPEVIGMKIEFRVPAEQTQEAEDLMTRLVSQSLRPEESLQLKQLAAEDVPEWKSGLITEDEMRQEEEFIAWLPKTLPEGWYLDRAWRELGQDRNYMTIEYHRTSENSTMERDYIDWTITLTDEEPEMIDVMKPETYAFGLYGSFNEIPDKYWDNMMSPVFAREDVTLNILQARENASESSHERPGINLSILYRGDSDENVLVRVSGMAYAWEIWEMIPD